MRETNSCSIWSDWKFWIFIMQAMTFIFGGFAFMVIKFNDLKHTEVAIEKLNDEVKSLSVVVARIETRLSIVEAIYGERNKNK